MSRQLWSISKDEDSTACLDSFCQCSVPFAVEKCFLIFQFVALVLVLVTSEKSLTLSSLHPTEVFMYIDKLPLSLLGTQLSQVSLLSLTSPVIIFLTLFWPLQRVHTSCVLGSPDLVTALQVRPQHC